MSCALCSLACDLWLRLEYFKCSRCGNVWLDCPSEPEAWKCPSCGARGELAKGTA